MKDIRITYTYHKKDFDFDEEPTTGTIVLPVEENVAAELLISDLSQPIAAVTSAHLSTVSARCFCGIAQCTFGAFQGDDKILSISLK